MSPVSRRPIVRCVPALASVFMLFACVQSPVAPTTVATSASTAPIYRSAAFVVDVNTRAKSVRVSPPTTGIGATNTLTAASPFGAGVHPSLVGGDAIEMRTSNFASGTLGAVVPGKVLVTFDLTLVNRLRGVELGTPTFPTPPAGVTGVQAFPFEISVITSSGSSTGGGNEVFVSSPSFGAAIASADWDGAPHSFFNDGNCGPTSNDCFRYEPFGAIGSEGASSPRRVGFLVDPTVRDLRIRLIVAADIHPVVR